jgi:dethiobiotin synthetase/adenosylmethionine--8-amino-7-oxononanoate aminotransferase
VKRHVKGAAVTTLFQFKDPVSPHIAARDAEFIVSLPDEEELPFWIY